MKDEIDDIITIKKEKGLKSAIDEIEERLNRHSSTKLNELVDILNNEAFKDLFFMLQSQHGN